MLGKKTICRATTIIVAMLFVVCVAAIAPVQAQSAKVVSRPLTDEEVEMHTITNSSWSAGLLTVGLGDSVYLEVQVDNDTLVTNVVWSLTKPGSAAAVLMTSPLGTNVAIYDGGDLEDNEVPAVDGRRLLKPDFAGAYTAKATVYGSTGGVDVAVMMPTLTIHATEWLGNNGTSCGCHAGGGFFNMPDKVTPWDATGHASMLTRNINSGASYYGDRCIYCHTVGHNDDPAAVNGGFDDVATDLAWTFPATIDPTNWTDNVPSALKKLGNIQCENCHGPGALHAGSTDSNKISVSMSAGQCGQCHDALDHHTKNYEWAQSAHANGPVRLGSCAPCHSGTGFVEAQDPDYNGVIASKTMNPAIATASHNEGITCQACHDPHGGPNAHQIRTLADVRLGNPSGTEVAMITDGGYGKLCMNCHKARRTADEYIESNIGNPSSHFGPHHGPQGDMFVGKNAIEYGAPMVLPNAHRSIFEDSCADCHMQDVNGSGYAVFSNSVHEAGVHTFAMVDNKGTETTADDMDMTLACAPCHGVDPTTYSFDEITWGADYDGDGNVEGFQVEVDGLMSNLALRLPPFGDPTFDAHDLPTGTSVADIAVLKAAYNYLFVLEDKSRGIHNPKYTVTILNASLNDPDLPAAGAVMGDQIAYVVNDSPLLTWHVDDDGDKVADRTFNYAVTGDRPVVGDVNGDGNDDIAITRDFGGALAWHADLDGDGGTDSIFTFGSAGDRAVSGDVNGDGNDDRIITRDFGGQLVWHADLDGDGATDLIFAYGTAGDTAVVGDIDGDGTDDIAITRDFGGVLAWHVDVDRDGATDQIFSYGSAGDLGVAGNITEARP